MSELHFMLTTLTLAALFGGNTAFTALFAPLVFTKLPADVAGQFIRAVFPWYYLYLLVTSLIAGLLLLGEGQVWLGLVTLSISAMAVYCRTVLMPLINELRDAELAGDMDAAGQFKTQHRFSVAINVVQWLLSAYVLVSWAQPVIDRVAQ